MNGGSVRPTLVVFAVITLLALVYPVAWATHAVPESPYAILAVFGSTVISVASFVLTIAVAMLGAARREDRKEAKRRAFD